MSKILDFITTLLGEATSVIAVIAKILNIVLDLAGRIVALTGWQKAKDFVDFIEKHNIEGWLERIAKKAKNFKGS